MLASDDPLAGGADEAAPLLPAALSQQLPAQVAAVWHPSPARIMLFGQSAATSVSAAAAQSGSSTSALHEFSFDVFHVGSMPNLLYAWHAIFCELESTAGRLNPLLNPRADPEAWAAFLLRCVRSMRAELESSLLAAAAQLNHPGPASLPGSLAALEGQLAASNIALDEYKFSLLLLESAKSLLHLLEIFYFDPHSNLTAQLCDWTQRTLAMPTVQREEGDEAASEASGSMQDDDVHWACVYHLLLQGRLYECVQMIASCSSLSRGSHAPLTRQVLDCIETVPAVALSAARQRGPTTGVPFPEADEEHLPLDAFMAEFTSWRKHVTSLLASLDANPHPHLELLLQILLGDSDAMQSSASTNYLELFLGTLLYVSPFVSDRAEIGSILEQSMAKCEGEWKRLRSQENDGMDAENEEESLYTPIDTLRYHIMSSSLVQALQLMSSMLELSFFNAHVVAMLSAKGELQHEDALVGEKPQPLRLNESSINSNIPLLEFYLISYAQNLEAAAASVGAEGAEQMWQLAVEYYAACAENGRAYLTQLVRKVPLTMALPAAASSNPSTAALDPSLSLSLAPRRILLPKTIHKLLALCARFGLEEESSYVLTQAAAFCRSQGNDSLARVGADASASRDATSFGQAVFWSALMRDEAQGTSAVAPAAVGQMELVAEALLDALLLPHSPASHGTGDPASVLRRRQLAFQSLPGVLSHLPPSCMLPLESLSLPHGDFVFSATTSGADVILSFLSGFHAYKSFEFKAHHVAREAEAMQRKDAATSDGSDEKMDEGGSGPSAAIVPFNSAPLLSPQLSHCLSLHAFFLSESLGILAALLKHLPSLLPAHRKYWLPLVKSLVDLVDERPGAKLSSERRKERRMRRAQSEHTQPLECSAWAQQQPSSFVPALLPPPTVASHASSMLSSAEVGSVQALVEQLMHSSAKVQYAGTIGGAAAVKQLQVALNELAHQAIQRA